MRNLNAQELTAVAGGRKAANDPAAALAAITAALAAKGVTFSLAGTALTITTAQGSKTIQLPAQVAAKLAALIAPAPAAA